MPFSDIFHGVSNSNASVSAAFSFASGIAYVAAGILLKELTSMFSQSRTTACGFPVADAASAAPIVQTTEAETNILFMAFYGVSLS